jgi:hypothetical protein
MNVCMYKRVRFALTAASLTFIKSNEGYQKEGSFFKKNEMLNGFYRKKETNTRTSTPRLNICDFAMQHNYLLVVLSIQFFVPSSYPLPHTE